MDSQKWWGMAIAFVALFWSGVFLLFQVIRGVL